jgi:hypothetical protein
MIQANELKVGNWVFDNDYQTKVKLIYAPPAILLNELSLIPIELTCEILTDCGFKTDDNGNQWFNLQTHYLELILAADGFYYPIYVQMPELSCEPEQRINLQRIKYVHQLQNLYFILTGEELEITL